MVGKRRVLLVEDDPEHAQLIRDCLALDGSFIVDWVDYAHLIWDALDNNTYHIVLLDYRLPDGNGLDVLDEINDRCYQIPVVMVTAQGDEQVAAQSVQRGAADYVVKKIDLFSELYFLWANTMKILLLKAR